MVLILELGHDDDLHADDRMEEMLPPGVSSPSGDMSFHSIGAPLDPEYCVYSDDEAYPVSSALVGPYRHDNVLEFEVQEDYLFTNYFSSESDDDDEADIASDDGENYQDEPFLVPLVVSGFDNFYRAWDSSFWEDLLNNGEVPWDHPFYTVPTIVQDYPSSKLQCGDDSISSFSFASDHSDLCSAYVLDDIRSRNLEEVDQRGFGIVMVPAKSCMKKKLTDKVPCSGFKQEWGNLNTSEFFEEDLLLKRKKAGLLDCLNLSLVNMEHESFFEDIWGDQEEIRQAYESFVDTCNDPPKTIGDSDIMSA